MTFKVEDGTGVADANAYATEEFVTSYLADRGRGEENAWDTALPTERETAIVQATDFVEQRWGDRFLGIKEFLDISAARSTLTLTAQPLNTETVVLDAVTYTFNTILGGANSVLIGANTSDSITNLVAAILAIPASSGSLFGSGTVAHSTVTAEEGIGDTMLAEAKAKGTAGNGIVSTETLTNGSWSSATLAGGGDVPVPQPLSFPRENLFDRDGVAVAGIPSKLQQATAEYAVRAYSSNLMPDPVIDDTARTVVAKREKVGPIEEDTRYEEGAALSQELRPYPAADRLLSEYIATGGRVIRG